MSDLPLRAGSGWGTSREEDGPVGVRVGGPLLPESAFAGHCALSAEGGGKRRFYYCLGAESFCVFV